MEKYITLEELELKEKELVEEYNKEREAGRSVFADHALTFLDAVRYVQTLINRKYEGGHNEDFI